jgi:hypothetical protein
MPNKFQRDLNRLIDVLHYVVGNILNLMGGAVAVVAGVLALIFFGDRTMAFTFAVTSFLAGMFLVLRLGFRNLDLEERSEPRIKLECGLHLTGCRTFNNWRDNLGHLFPVCFYRIRVTPDSIGAIHGCRVWLTKISRQGEELWGDNNQALTFEPGEAENSTIRTIADKMEAFADVLILTSNGNVLVGTKGRGWAFDRSLGQIFSAVGKYTIVLLVTAKDTRSIKAHLQFNWTGHWNLSDLTLLRCE